MMDMKVLGENRHTVRRWRRVGRQESEDGAGASAPCRCRWIARGKAPAVETQSESHGQRRNRQCRGGSGCERRDRRGADRRREVCEGQAPGTQAVDAACALFFPTGSCRFAGRGGQSGRKGRGSRCAFDLLRQVRRIVRRHADHRVEAQGEQQETDQYAADEHGKRPDHTGAICSLRQQPPIREIASGRHACKHRH